MTELRWSTAFEPSGEFAGASFWLDNPENVETRWRLLRARWEDQLRLIAPDAWSVLEAELAPIEQACSEILRILNETRVEAGVAHRELVNAQKEHKNASTWQNKYLEERNEARSERDSAYTDRDLAVADAGLLAEQVQALATMLASTKDGDDKPGWLDLVPEEVGASVARQLGAGALGGDGE